MSSANKLKIAGASGCCFGVVSLLCMALSNTKSGGKDRSLPSGTFYLQFDIKKTTKVGERIGCRDEQERNMHSLQPHGMRLSFSLDR